MKSPYFIDEPAAISFSGGRTSAYMLYKILEAHDGKLPDDVKVTFANTGKEMPETLDFVQACSDNWDVPIVWLELVDPHINQQGVSVEYRVTNYSNASRKGEPFEALLHSSPAIPNAVARNCTAYLKTRVMRRYMDDQGFERGCLSYLGIRGDEQRRAIKLHMQRSEGFMCVLPLYEAGVAVAEIGEFWRRQNFDLQLPNNNGVTDWGNCDLCFLKGRSKRLSIIRERPDLADWWIEAEKRKGQFFRPDQPSYEQMKIIASDQGQLFDFDDESIPCFCGD